MRVVVKLFAQHRAAVGRPEITLELPQGASAREAVEALAREWSTVDARGSMVAVNTRYASPELILNEGDELALLPPVSGG